MGNIRKVFIIKTFHNIALYDKRNWNYSSSRLYLNIAPTSLPILSDHGAMFLYAKL